MAKGQARKILKEWRIWSDPPLIKKKKKKHWSQKYRNLAESWLGMQTAIYPIYEIRFGKGWRI